MQLVILKIRKVWFSCFGDGTATWEFLLGFKCANEKQLCFTTKMKGRENSQKGGRKGFGVCELKLSSLVWFTQMVDIQGRGHTDKKL